MGALDDAFHKFERGKEHLADFNSRAKRAFNPNTLILDIKTHPCKKPIRSRDISVWYSYIVYVKCAPSIKWDDAIILGEAIQCFRSSLDYIAWALCMKHGKLTETEEKHVAFPMTNSRNEFDGAANRALPNVPANERAFLSGISPTIQTRLEPR